MKKLFELLPPSMPNYILVNGPGKKDDMSPPCIAIESLSESEAFEYAELMKTEFITHWRRRVKQS